MIRRITLAAMALALGGGCTPPEPPAPSAGEPTLTQGASAAAILPRPFTAEQIRDEWVQGFRLDLRRVAPGVDRRERWTVLSADAEGAEIEFAVLDAQGNVAGEPRVVRSLWTELLEHATFPAERSTRAEARRDTALGSLDGWLYTLRDEEQGTVTEMFFGKELPGAPVHLLTTRDGQPIEELSQIARHRPARS